MLSGPSSRQYIGAAPIPPTRREAHPGFQTRSPMTPSRASRNLPALPWPQSVSPLPSKPSTLAARGAADPTFAEDVAPISIGTARRVTGPGGLGPFSLMDYDSAKANVDEIKEKVSLRQMPPWHADGPKGVFRNDRRLSESERGTILRWIDAGAKPGDMKKLSAETDVRDEHGRSARLTPLSAWRRISRCRPQARSSTCTSRCRRTSRKKSGCRRSRSCRARARSCTTCSCMHAFPAPPAAAQPPAAAPTPRPAGAPAPAPLFVRRRDHALPPADSPRQRYAPCAARPARRVDRDDGAGNERIRVSERHGVACASRHHPDVPDALHGARPRDEGSSVGRRKDTEQRDAGEVVHASRVRPRRDGGRSRFRSVWRRRTRGPPSTGRCRCWPSPTSSSGR